jgi:peptidyl-prolyl cis-trans isomerase A (cyclophilin A)
MKQLLVAVITMFTVWACNGQDNNKVQTKQEPVKSDQTNVEQTGTNQAQTETFKLGENEMAVAVIKTNMGTIEVQLNRSKAPITVDNFVKYVNSGFYDGLIFHRVISNFMIQGGGFTPDGNQKTTNAPIVLESNNGLNNEVGTIAMARTNVPNSATSQFFINVADNSSLNYAPGNPGYAVFGNVISGMDIVYAISKVATSKPGDKPLKDVVMESVTIEKRAVK